MPKNEDQRPRRLWCGHEEYAEGCCAVMACRNYYMKVAWLNEEFDQ